MKGFESSTRIGSGVYKGNDGGSLYLNGIPKFRPGMHLWHVDEV